MKSDTSLGRLVDSHVTGFRAASHAYAIYVGSFLWAAALVAVDVALLASRDWPRLDSLLGTLIGVNVLGFVLQTIDVLGLHMRFWPLLALYWTCQLSAIALSTAALGYALAMDVPEDQIAPRHALIFTRVVAQCLWTASQFSVTLEYLHRAVATPPPTLPIPSKARAVAMQRMSRR